MNRDAVRALKGRFQQNDYLLTACRYVERNPVRAGVVTRAQDWRWGSLWRREHGTPEQKAILAEWPIPRPRGADWLKRVNQPATKKEFDALVRAMAKGCPYGEAAWRDRLAARLGIEYTLRDPGRPKIGSSLVIAHGRRNQQRVGGVVRE